MQPRLLLVSCIAFAGCAAQPIYVPLPPSHPASPWAPESALPQQTGTLAIREDSKVPAHPDWQIPGMRDNEMHGHAAGQPSSMDMMGHGHMMMGMKGESGEKKAPGMVKMSAQKDKVDYAPKDAVHSHGREPDEHEPEFHLDHTDPARRKAGFQAAPIAPPMKHGDKAHEGHDDHEMHGAKSEPGESKSPPGQKPTPKAKVVEQDAADHESMDHSGHNMEMPSKSENRPSPADTPIPSDHSNHG